MRMKGAVWIIFSLCCSLSFQQELEPDFEVEGSGVNSTDDYDSTASLLDDDYSISANEDDGTVTVKTLLGAITGVKEMLPSGDEVCKFLGIPYAKPPVAERRFMPPVPTGFFGEMNAMEFGSKCVQNGDFTGGDLFDKTITGSEDCLFLNVYTKLGDDMMDNSSIPAKHNAYAGKAVMVWIHGGGFTLGSGDEYNPAPLLAEDVIVVTLNYRLGGFGFLTFGNDIVSGNMGLKDQIEAIKWVQRNIIYFGGDPNKVTIFGESAGGISVSALHVSPKAMGLFSGAIMQSGTVLFRRDDPKKSADERAVLPLAKNFNCTSPNYDYRTLKCLQQIDAVEFHAQTLTEVLSVDKEEEDQDRGSWGPVLDDYSSDPVMPTEPLYALKTGKFNKVPIITGTVKNDGGLIYPAELEKLWNLTAPSLIGLSESINKSESTVEENLKANIVLKYYTGGSLDLLESLDEFVNMMTDAWFLSPDQKLAELVSPHAPVYNYRFTYAGTNTFLPFYLKGSGIPEEAAPRVFALKPVHADELIYLFNILGNRNEEEEEVSRSMVKYWTNFAKYGHPSPFIQDDLTAWKSYSNEKRYMEFSGQCAMREEVEQERMLFWQDVLWNQKEQKIHEEGMMSKALHMVLRLLGIRKF